MTPGPLVDQVALVTGASSGIGEAIARMLAAQGAHVVALARRVDRLAQLGVRLREQHPHAGFTAIGCDLRDTDALVAAFDRVRDELGGVRILVNNAGLGRDAPLCTGNTAHFREMLDVNVLALAVCTREAVGHMFAAGDVGHVVHVSSMAAHRVPQGGGMYSASKFAVRALLEALRQELRARGSRIRVGAVSPGYVRTEFAEVQTGSPEAAASIYGRFPVLEPGDVAEAVRGMLVAPEHVQIHDVLMRSTQQPD